MRDVHYSRLSRQRGANLIELMIVLVLALVITAGIYQLFSANQRTYRLQNALSEVQENGRFVLDVLQRDLRHAGYAPACQGDAGSGVGLVLNLKDGTANNIFPNDRFDAVGGWQSRGNDAYTSGIGANDYQQGNLLLIHHAATPAEQRVVQDINAGGQNVTLGNEGTLETGDLLAFIEKNNCEIVETTSDKKLSAPKPFTQAFTGGASWIGKPEASIYYIGWDSTRSEPGLRRRDVVSGRSETLASPVVDMELRFLVGDKYVQAPPSAGWRDISAVRVSLLLRSSETNVLDSPAKVTVGDIDFQAGKDDLRLYQGFTTTIALRNRLVEGRR
ncbi:type IV pilus assembly protein PilW [Onishia taeanensis]|uniref:Type IV pilus assembly protein PilW n=1 Tax=Onishia taeanensis TaxID=284577 RepID=A0A1G7TN88_9GAMM|nr:PilW family protein [Halomonas taeanensis]SDG36572.1 type IV pilus assembly protein PilW [Halomonas taeanensis]